MCFLASADECWCIYRSCPTLYLHWSSVFRCVLRTKSWQAAASYRPADQLGQYGTGWMMAARSGWPMFFKCSFQHYVARHFLQVAGTAVLYQCGLNFVLMCMWTVHSEDVYVWLQRQNLVQRCAKAEWQQLARESNGLSCFLFYYLNHCGLAMLLAIFPSPPSPSVHSRWVLIQEAHNLLELWGNSEREKLQC